MGLARRLAILLCLSLLTGGCAVTVQPPSAVEAARDSAPGVSEGGFLLADGAPLTVADVLQRARSADYILMGETHTSACDHRMQAQLLRSLVGEGIRPVVGLEMLPASTNPELARFSSGAVSLSELPEAVNWKTWWGYEFALYRPVFEVIATTGLPVVALNLPHAVARKAGAVGLDGLTPAERDLLPAAVQLSSTEQRNALEPVFREHMQRRSGMEQKAASGATSAPISGAAPSAAPSAASGATSGAVSGAAQGTSRETPQAAPPVAPHVSPQAASEVAPEAVQRTMDKFFTVQAVWDSTMAHEAVKARRAFAAPVYILAGGGHVGFGWGIASRIRLYDPAARILLVMPWRGGELPDAAEGDVFFRCRASGARLGLAFSFAKGAAQVVGVEPGSRAAEAGFRAGDVIVKVGGLPVESPSTLHEAGAAALAKGEGLEFTVRRDDAEMILKVPAVRSDAARSPSATVAAP